MRRIILAAAISLAGTSGYSQQYPDPQAVVSDLLRRHLESDAQRRQNEAMHLELERLDLERQLRYRRLSDTQIMGELARYCPKGEPPCNPSPPDSLLQEAANRGLIQFNRSPASPPGQDCMILGLGGGDALLDCQ
jgi:hypothetical protein